MLPSAGFGPVALQCGSGFGAECGKPAARRRPAFEYAGKRRAGSDHLSQRLGLPWTSRNIRIEFRLAAGHAEHFPELAQALVRDKASVIVASGDAAVRAAQQVTKTIPIIAVVDDIVASGLINNMAKPGGNITGVSILATELDGKRADILKRIVVSARRFAVLSDPSSAQARPQQLIDTARALGIELITEEVRSPSEFAAAFASFRAKGAEAVIIAQAPSDWSIPRDGRCGLRGELWC